MAKKMIALTEDQFQIISEIKLDFERTMGGRMSWGAFLVTLCFWNVNATKLYGTRISCPQCGSITDVVLVKPTLVSAEGESASSGYQARRHLPET